MPNPNKEIMGCTLKVPYDVIFDYFMANSDKTLKQIAEHFDVSPKVVQTATTRYLEERKPEVVKEVVVQWAGYDEHELEGELNYEHDFRKLIYYEKETIADR